MGPKLWGLHFIALCFRKIQTKDGLRKILVLITKKTRAILLLSYNSWFIHLCFENYGLYYALYIPKSSFSRIEYLFCLLWYSIQVTIHTYTLCVLWNLPVFSHIQWKNLTKFSPWIRLFPPLSTFFFFALRRISPYPHFEIISV